MVSAKARLVPPPPPKSHTPSRAVQLSVMDGGAMDVLAGKQDKRSAALPPIVPSFPVRTGTKKPSGSVVGAAAAGGGAAAAAAAAVSKDNNSDGVTKSGATATIGTPVLTAKSAETSTAATATQDKPATVVKVGNRFISSNKPARKWVWASFSSSARPDGAKFRHWVRAGVEYPDYPYARFDIHLDPITYTDQEYRRFLQHSLWTKAETDKLMELCQLLELRWAVIYDRWSDYAVDTHTDGVRRLEDLQHRYYTVAARILQSRISKEAADEVARLAATDQKHSLDAAAAREIAMAEPEHQPYIAHVGAGVINKEVFDLNRERQRRAYLDVLWHRTKEEELEEAALKKELGLVEARIKKLKKSGAHLRAADAPSRAVSPAADTAAALQQGFAATAPTPLAGTPYLQSGRLVPPGTGGKTGLNKNTLKRMDSVLQELQVPDKLPVPTKRVCDLYDAVRRDALLLFSLQKIALQRDGQLRAKRLRLSKLGSGQKVMEEETLMGVAPPPAAATSSSTVSSKSKGKGKVRSAGGSGGGSKSKAKDKGNSSSGNTTSADDKNKGDASGSNNNTSGGSAIGTTTKTGRKTTGTKRKKKADSKNSTTTGTSASTSTTTASTGATTATATAAGSATTTKGKTASGNSSSSSGKKASDGGGSATATATAATTTTPAKPSKKRARKS